MIKAILFDFNGVYLESIEPKIFLKGIKKFKVSPIIAGLKYLIFHFHHQTGRMDSYRHWMKIFNKNINTFTHEDYEDTILKPYEKAKMDKELLKFTNVLQDEEIKTALLSNTGSDQATVNFKLGRYHEFFPIFLSNVEHLMKPDPRFYTKALKKLKLKGEECVFVDDQLQNLIVPYFLGIKVIWHTDTKKTIKKIKEILKKENIEKKKAKGFRFYIKNKEKTK